MALNKYGGFADGFTQGFGLVSNVQDNFARQELAEEELRLRDEDRKERRKDRQADLDYRTCEVIPRARRRCALTTAAPPALCVPRSMRVALDAW